MQSLVRIEVTDRKHIDGYRGLHAHLVFRANADNQKFSLTGLAWMCEQMEITAVEIVENDLELSSETSCVLVRAACIDCWKAVMIDCHAAAGIQSRPTLDWLDTHHLPRTTVSREIAAAMAQQATRLGTKYENRRGGV